MTAPEPGAAPPRTPPRWLRPAVDYLGPAAFMIGFFLTGRNLVHATWWLVGGSAAALVLSYAVERRIAPMPALWGGAAIVFGLLTLIFHDPRIIQMKMTIVDGALGAFLLGSCYWERTPLKNLVFGKWSPNRSNPLSLMLGDAIKLSDEGWRKLTVRFGVFFLLMAVLNELVWRTQPQPVWVAFRFPIAPLLALLFAATQAPMMVREAKAAETTASATAKLTELQE